MFAFLSSNTLRNYIRHLCRPLCFTDLKCGLTTEYAARPRHCQTTRLCRKKVFHATRMSRQDPTASACAWRPSTRVIAKHMRLQSCDAPRQECHLKTRTCFRNAPQNATMLPRTCRPRATMPRLRQNSSSSAARENLPPVIYGGTEGGKLPRRNLPPVIYGGTEGGKLPARFQPPVVYNSRARESLRQG